MTTYAERRTGDSVLVTGIGLVTSNGCGSSDITDKQRTMLLSDSTVKGQTPTIGRVIDFDQATLLGQKGLRHMSRATLFLLAATRMAMGMAGVDADNTERQESIGMVAGTVTCNAAKVADFDRTILTEGPQMVDPGKFPETVWNSSSSHAAIRFGLRGMNTPVCSGMNSGLDAILFAEAHVRDQNEDIVIAGGFEELTPYFSVLFENNAKGKPELPFGEGASVLVLEKASSAQARNIAPLAKIYGGASIFVPSLKKENAAYGLILEKFVAQTLEDNRCDPSEVKLVWLLNFAERHGGTTFHSTFEPLRRHGFDPHIVELTKHVGYCGGLAGGLAAALAVSTEVHIEGDKQKAVDEIQGHIELVISNDGQGRIAILIVEKNR